MSLPDCGDWVNLLDLRLDEYMFPNDGDRNWLRRPYHYSVTNRDRSVHHVIPASRLRQFYNSVINNARNNNEVMTVFGRFLQRMYDSIYNRVEISLPEEVNPSVFLRAFQNFHDPSMPVRVSRFGWGRTIVLNLFNWLPGNLFLGPRPESRTDDPRDSFEVRARNVFDPDHFRRLENLDRLITRYINQRYEPLYSQDFDPNTAVRLGDIVSLLNDIITHSIVYNYDENDWDTDNQGMHNIRTTTPRHDELRKRQLLKDDIVDNIPFKIMADGTCIVTDNGTSYSSTDKTACTVAWIALASVPDRVAIDTQYPGNLLKTISFKSPLATWSTDNMGMQQDYYLRGKVEDVFYNVMEGKCYIAIDDDKIQYKNKFHESTNPQICLTAVGALINNEVVVAKAALGQRPGEPPVISKLFVGNQCKTLHSYYM